MLDWLKPSPSGPPRLRLGERDLPVVIRRLPHARRMTLRLAPDGSEVRLSIPRWGRTAEALAFADSRRDWLESQLDALPRPRVIVPGEAIPFRGEELRIVHEPAARRRPVAREGPLSVGGPAEALALRIRRWLEGEARVLLAEDLAHYCGRAGLETPRLGLSSARRRWGSCSAQGTIRINWRLIMAPDFVRRSVVAHEVAHLVHFDHGRAFHAYLDALYEDDVRLANRWLKQHGRGLHAWFD